MNQHLKAIQFHLHSLNKKIANENKRPFPGHLVLQRLKKDKLDCEKVPPLQLA